MTKSERFLIRQANRQELTPPLRPSQRKDDINEAEHAKREGQYEAYLVDQAIRAASKGVK